MSYLRRMNKRGIALILVFMVIAVLTVLGGAVVSRSISEGRIVQRYVASTRAFWLAEAGIQRAVWELNDGGGTWAGWGGSGDTRDLQASLAETGDYDVIVNGLMSSPNNLSITSIGACPDRIAVNASTRSIDATVQRSSSGPTYAMFGIQSVSMSGNGKTDSYDSSKGAYGGSNKGSNGDIGTNGTTPEVITLTGNATVNGDAGTGANGTVKISGNAKVNGTITHDKNESFSSAEVPVDLVNLPSSGSYSVGGNSSNTISGGNYEFSSMGISGNGKLTINGKARIYLTDSSALGISGNGQLVISSGAELTIYSDGKCAIGGNGVANNTNLPKNFIIYSTYAGTGDGVQLTGNSDLKGAIYAPDTAVKISGNGSLYGAIIGKTLSVTGNGDIHYDEALAQVVVSLGTYAVQLWREQQNPYALTP